MANSSIQCAASVATSGPPRPRPSYTRAALLLGAFLSLTMTLLAADVRDPETHFFQQSFGNLGEEIATAAEQGKTGLLVMFQMDECPFCHRMKNEVLNRSDVQDYFREHFVILSIDVEGDLEITDFSGETLPEKEFALNRLRVRATPVFAFFDLEGNLVARYTGATRDPREFMQLGEYVVQGAYTDKPFSVYKRERARQTEQVQGE